MKFLMKKTSHHDESIPPVDGCTLEQFTYVHTRTCTEEEFNTKFGPSQGLWRSKGEKHRTTNDGKWISRDHPKDASGWFKDFSDLSELVAFVQEHGDCVIGPSYMNHAVLALEIYDDYRE